MTTKALFIYTETQFLPDGKTPTGWYLPEGAHPFYALKKEGYEIDHATPNGKPAYVDPGSVQQFKDEESTRFLKEFTDGKTLNNPLDASKLDFTTYDVIFAPGGHGPLFDLANDKALAKRLAEFYERGNTVVAAICHGPAALVPVVLKDGSPLVKGHVVACLSDNEERKYNMQDLVPFLVETRMKELGARVIIADVGKENSVISGRLVTGQNPASGHAVARDIIATVKLTQNKQAH